MKLPYLLVTAATLLVLAFLGRTAAQAVPVEAKLTIVGDKTTFRAGETIWLNLSYTSPTAGFKVVDGGTRSDKVIVSPTTGLFDVVKDYYFGEEPASDSFTITDISDKFQPIKICLNSYYRFDNPAEYTVRLVTRRVVQRKINEDARKYTEPVEITTNPITFKIVPMSNDDEAAEAKRLSLAIDQASDLKTKTELAEELANLPGDGAVPVKVSHFLKTRSEPGNGYAGALFTGIFISRNRSLVITELEAALNDISRPLDFEVLSLVSSVRARREIAASSRPYVRRNSYEPGPEDPDDPFAKAERYYEKLVIDSLPKRQGKSLYESAYTLLRTRRDRLVPELKAALRTIVLKNFDSLDMFSREDLLGYNWPEIKDVSLVPSIELMLKDKSYPPYGRINVQGTALKRLNELNAEKARQYMALGMKDQDFILYDEVLEGFDGQPMPEADKDMLGQIRRLAADPSARNMTMLRWRCELVAKFASGGIYDQLIDVYKNYSSHWEPDAKGLLLGYFAKYKPSEAVALVQEEIKRTELADRVLSEFARFNYPTEVAEFFESRLASDDVQVAGQAAYVISLHGSAKDRQKIESRLRGLHPETDANQARLQVDLIMTLIQGKAWTLSETDKIDLRSICITEICKQTFHW
jgi:hypothetical protein